jgi:hypothetical protein
VVGGALGQRDPVVDAQQVGVLRRRLLLDEDDDVVDTRGDLGRQRVERLLDQSVEDDGGNLQRHTDSVESG